MNRRIKLAIAAGVVALALALSVGVGITAPPEILWSVFGSGGNSSSSTNFALGSTSGQSSPIGASGSTNYSLNAGFWTGAGQPPPAGKLPWPGDTDGDGCPDVNENLGKEFATQGGGRDWEDPYDWYDVNQDGVIDLLVDILGVITHYAPGGAPPYDIVFDRGPTTGPNAWNMTVPDGVIDLLIDILGVIQQYSPGGCTEP